MKIRENFRLVWLVAQRELIDQLRDWRVIMPMVILVLFFPYLMNFAARQAVDFINQYGASTVAERIIPFLILIVGFFPVTVSLVVALESFVGEKERGTIEPLLSSPLQDWHMYFGKLIAGILVPLMAGYLSTGLYLAGLIYQQIALPELEMILQTISLSLVQTVLMVSAAMVISTQSTSVRAANLLASFIVIPVALLIQGESVLLFLGDNQVLWYAVFGVALMSGLIIRLGLAHFQRERLIGREIDVLSMSFVLERFWFKFSGQQEPLQTYIWVKTALTNLLLRFKKEKINSLGLWPAIKKDILGIPFWYATQLIQSLKGLKIPLIVVIVTGIFASVFSYAYIDQNFQAQANMDMNKIVGLLDEQISATGISAVISAPVLFFNNLRAEILIMFFGMFSFGVIGLLVYMLNFSLIGAVLGGLGSIGISPWLVLVSGILPHGIFELPSVMLATASMLHMGLRLVTPERNLSIGEVSIDAFAEWMKVMVGICIPLLIVAALIEVYITPILMVQVLQGFIPTGP